MPHCSGCADQRLFDCRELFRRKLSVPVSMMCARKVSRSTMAVSLLDRLLHHSVVVLTDGESFRMREARQRGGGRTTRTS